MDRMTGDEGCASRFVVGIDLGTTNSAVTYVDTAEAPWKIRTFEVPQLVAPGQVESRETLPSYHYEPAPGELSPGALRLPWSPEEPRYAVGFFARDQGTKAPGRLIASAKSWLCHSGVDRTAELLPWHGAADVARLSPVEASARYLAHIRDAWNARFTDHPLEEQDLVLTLPASFDEVARQLTIKAAAEAALSRVILIEEPQAAFYAWIYAHAETWQQRVNPGQKILICDIGGGTSDFTLIRVRSDRAGKVQFHRVAVGEHLILGGDNLDLALARHVEQRLVGEDRLEPRQWSVLVNTCRQVKESLLADRAPQRLTLHLPGTGSRLIGGGLRIELTRQEIHSVLLDGFFPRVGLEDKPARRQSGFQEFGLPYAPDPAVTRYLAAFLTAHRHGASDEEAAGDHDPARPDIVLFNGGVFESPAIKRRVLEVLASWFQSPGQRWEPIVLENERLDLAVARGAAYFGMVRRGQGVRIAAGLPRTYYIGVESDREEALCLVPAGSEPGEDVDLTQARFELRVSEPVEFPLFVSSTRLTDKPGQRIEVDREQMTPLPPIRTVLKQRSKAERGSLPVQLHARLTEIGTLDLWCTQVGGKGRWRLQFDVRSATRTDVGAHEGAAEQAGFLDESIWEAMEELIQGTFGPRGNQPPERLARRLAQASGMNRKLWPPSLLRRIWESLIDLEPGRRRSQVHEARWLNLLGFALRPGYGLAVDDWRVAHTWRILQNNLIHATPMCRSEWWILWRRIAGGLGSGQQQALAEPLVGAVRGLHKQQTTGTGRGGAFPFASHEAAEVFRLLGSLELLPVSLKIDLGTMLVDLVPKRKMEPLRPAIVWAVGRLGARAPLYGPLNTVVPADEVGRWLEKLLQRALPDPTSALAVMQMARRTDDRYRDLPARLREKALAWLHRHGAPEHFAELVRDGGQLDAEEQGLVFGESLPRGLRIQSA